MRRPLRVDGVARHEVGLRYSLRSSPFFVFEALPSSNSANDRVCEVSPLLTAFISRHYGLSSHSVVAVFAEYLVALRKLSRCRYRVQDHDVGVINELRMFLHHGRVPFPMLLCPRSVPSFTVRRFCSFNTPTTSFDEACVSASFVHAKRYGWPNLPSCSKVLLCCSRSAIRRATNRWKTFDPTSIIDES